MGIVLTPATWFRLQSALRLARNRLRKNDDTENLLENISNFLSRIKKGSKKFRLIIECNINRLSDPSTLRTVNTFADLAACLVPVLGKLKRSLGLWNMSWICNYMRQFLFLLRNNGIMLNNRLNAIDDTVSPYCTFCKIINRDTVTRDSFLHFFRNCPVTARLLEVWSSLFEPIQQINSPSFQALYWYGVCPGNIADNGYTLLVVDSFKYVLWKFKKRKKIPNLISFNREYFFTLSNISNMSKKVRLGISNSNFLTNFLPGLG